MEDINFETIKKLDKAVTEGIRVTTNYGQGIIAGEIKAMLLLLKHPVDNYYLLVEGNYGLGYIKFFEPLEVTEQDLIDNNLMNIGMSKETINIIFGDGIKDFWLYEIEDFILLPEPKNLSMNYEIVLSFNYKEEIEKINKGKEIIFDDIELYDFELTSITSPQVIIPKKIKKEIDKWNSLTNKEIQDMKSEDFPKNYFSIRLHWALGIHIDFLTKINGDLEGMTIACIQKGMTPKDKTMQNLKDLSNKIDDDKYFKFTPDMKGESHVLAIPKTNEPLESLKLIDIDNKDGLFCGIDNGLLWQGTQLSYFKEYFLYGKLFNRRLIFVEITTGDRKYWQASLTDDNIPYLLTRRGRIANNYVPPEGESGLSPDWENIIPDDMKWWIDKFTEKEIKDRMNQAYNWLIENEYLLESDTSLGLPLANSYDGSKMKESKKEFFTNCILSLPDGKYNLIDFFAGRGLLFSLFKENLSLSKSILIEKDAALTKNINYHNIEIINEDNEKYDYNKIKGKFNILIFDDAGCPNKLMKTIFKEHKHLLDDELFIFGTDGMKLKGKWSGDFDPSFYGKNRMDYKTFLDDMNDLMLEYIKKISRDNFNLISYNFKSAIPGNNAEYFFYHLLKKD